MTSGPPREPGGHWRVEVEGGPTFEVARDEDTLLRGALRAGCGWAYECSVGGCGSCRFDLLQGEVAELWPAAPGLSARDRQRGKRLACQTRVLGHLRVRVRLGAAAPADAPAPRRQPARLVEVRPLTHDMAEFSFDTGTPSRFVPGQYALLHLPGVAGVRAYSMANLPNDAGCWQFVVKRMPGGQGSAALFGQLAVGQAVEIDGPYGHAGLRAGTGRGLVCIAGGSGLGPMLSIVRGALAAGGGPPVQLFVGLRSQADLGCLSLLQGLASERLHVCTVLSAAQAEPPWAGATGFVHEVVERGVPQPLRDLDFYLAGPPPMVEATQAMLMGRHQVHPGQIRFDRFV